jgi:AcrR family transcriptional regulator
MARTTKDRLQRKQELADVAERLFLEKGYDQTAVSDIVREIDVSQGTFYYYFSSKEEVLEAVIDKGISALDAEIRQIRDLKDVSASVKLNEAVNEIFGMLFAKREILDYIHREGNAILHDRLLRRTIARLVPPVRDLVEEGVAEGKFCVLHPAETVEFLISAIIYIFHEPEIAADEGHRVRMMATLEDILAKALGVQGFSFKLQIETS